jgi:hypothetical protein
VAVGGIPIFGGLAAIFAGLEFSRLLYIMPFEGKSPDYASLKSGRHTSVHHPGMVPASGSILYIRKSCVLFCRRCYAVTKKNEVKTE